jgi:Domain of unknown function (DUF4365)
MTNKEINRESQRIFEGLLLPSWAFRSQEDQEDYGIDGEIEITSPEDKATGFIFKVQLKGTASAAYDEEGQLVFSAASVERFSYYISQIRIPLIFIVCDVVTRECYWIGVQGNRQLEASLNAAIADGQQTFTVKLPPSHKIQKAEQSAAEIVQAVVATYDAITVRTLRSVSTAAVVEHIRYDADGDNAEKTFRHFAGIAANEAIRKLFNAGDVPSALKKSHQIFESKSESPEARILAGAAFVHAYEVAERQRGRAGATVEAARLRFGIASEMISIARHEECEKGVKRYARIYLRASRMLLNSISANALAISEEIQAAQGETMAGPITQIQRMAISAQVTRDFLRLLRATFRLADGSPVVIPYAVVEISGSILPFIFSLRLLEREDLAEGYITALFDLLPPCIAVLKHYEGDEDSRATLKNLGLRLAGLGNVMRPGTATALLDRFEEAVRKGPALRFADEVLAELRVFIEEIQTETASSDRKPSMDELRAFFAQRAAELGINLDDPNDRIAEVVRIGIQDLDPTRVLKNCQHMHVITTFRGVPAEMLGLPTAGGKRIICLKHGHAVENLSLDNAYEFFAKSYPWTKGEIRCDNCPDKAPHPEGWEWSEEWNIEQHATYQELRKAKKTEEEDLPD